MGNPNPVQCMNPNPNENIQMIYVDPREANIVVITRGVSMGEDQEEPYRQPRVHLIVQKKAPFDVQNEREILLDSQQEFVHRNQASTSGRPILEMLEIFYQLLQKQSTRNASKLHELFKSFLKLIQDKYHVAKLTTLIEEPQEEVRPEKRG